MPSLSRLLRHLTCTASGTRALFTPAVLTEIENAIGEAERQHAGEIRFAVETALPLALLWHDVSPRTRAMDVFAHLRVWDTHANNGVLIYVLRADRALEIIADRGINARVSEAEWQAVCRAVEAQFRLGDFAGGSRAAIAGVAQLLAQHFPAQPSGPNELPNQPVLL